MISMKISPRRVDKYLIFSTLLAGTRVNSSIYSNVNYFPKIEDHFSQENDKFEFLKLILSLKTMINRTFFFCTLPPPPHEARSRFVSSGCI